MKALLMWRPKSKSTKHPLPVDVHVQLGVGAFISMASLANRAVSRRMAGMRATNKAKGTYSNNPRLGFGGT